MSWKDYKNRVEGVRRVRWDALWHIIYRVPKGDDSRETYDRVSKKVAMYVIKNMGKWSYQEKKGGDW